MTSIVDSRARVNTQTVIHTKRGDIRFVETKLILARPEAVFRRIQKLWKEFVELPRPSKTRLVSGRLSRLAALSPTYRAHRKVARQIWCANILALGNFAVLGPKARAKFFANLIAYVKANGPAHGLEALYLSGLIDAAKNSSTNFSQGKHAFANAFGIGGADTGGVQLPFFNCVDSSVAFFATGDMHGVDSGIGQMLQGDESGFLNAVGDFGVGDDGFGGGFMGGVEDGESGDGGGDDGGGSDGGDGGDGGEEKEGSSGSENATPDGAGHGGDGDGSEGADPGQQDCEAIVAVGGVLLGGEVGAAEVAGAIADVDVAGAAASIICGAILNPAPVQPGGGEGGEGHPSWDPMGAVNEPGDDGDSMGDTRTLTSRRAVGPGLASLVASDRNGNRFVLSGLPQLADDEDDTGGASLGFLAGAPGLFGGGLFTSKNAKQTGLDPRVVNPDESLQGRQLALGAKVAASGLSKAAQGGGASKRT